MEDQIQSVSEQEVIEVLSSVEGKEWIKKITTGEIFSERHNKIVIQHVKDFWHLALMGNLLYFKEDWDVVLYESAEECFLEVAPLLLKNNVSFSNEQYIKYCVIPEITILTIMKKRGLSRSAADDHFATTNNDDTNNQSFSDPAISSDSDLDLDSD
jgi:hypothetical protein